jgi:hypothetical protein
MPQQPSGSVHRLKDIVVEEVSLVDHPANKRRFIIVKRDEMTKPLESDGRGGFRVTKAKADDEERKDDEGEENDEEEKAKKAKGKGKPPPFAEKADTDGEGDEDADENEEKAKKVDASGMALAKELRSHVAALSKLADSLEKEEEDEPSDVHMRKLSAMHKKIGGMCEKYMTKTQKREVEKIGRKMAASRLELFQKALGTMQQLLTELLDSPAKMKEHDADPGDPQGKPKGWSPGNPSDAPTGKDGTAGGVTKGDEERATALQKRIDELSTEVAKLRRGGARSNSLPVERSTTRKNTEEVSWPLDMNKPIDRESVDKRTSFFDDD